MMNIIKRIVLILMIIFLMLGASGCGMRRESTQDRMVAYINSKYEDNFTFKSVFGGSIGSATKKIIVSSEKFPGKDIYVMCIKKNGTEVYTDNYLGVKFAKQTQDEITFRLQSFFGSNCFASYYPSNLACTQDGSDQTEFDVYIATDSSGISFEAVVAYPMKDIDKEVLLEKVNNAFRGMCATGWVYFVDSEEDFSGANGGDLFTTYIEQKKYILKLYFYKTNSEEIQTFEWMD